MRAQVTRHAVPRPHHAHELWIKSKASKSSTLLMAMRIRVLCLSFSSRSRYGQYLWVLFIWITPFPKEGVASCHSAQFGVAY